MSFDLMLEKAQASVSDSTLNARYDGEQQLSSVGLSIPPGIRNLEVVVNWPRLVVDMTAEVLTVEGFECAEASVEQMELVRKIWQRNDMDTLSNLAHTEALTQGEAYVIVGLTEDGAIKTTVHARDGFAVRRNADGTITEACVTFSEENEAGDEVEKAAYYTPDTIEVYQHASGGWGRVNSSPGIGMVPVIPVRNAARISDENGRSEMNMVIPFGDAGSRSFTLLQLATEVMSYPQRWIAGVKQDNFVRPDGSKPTQEEIYLGALMTAPDSSAKFGQFAGADLSQIINVIKTCATQVSALTGIPPSMLGVVTDNPTSAEAMRAAKERMISRCERKCQMFGDAWETWARLVLAFSGEDTSGLETLHAVWRDVAMPSASAKAANLLQAHSQGVITARTAREGLPLTPEQRAFENKNEAEAEAVGASDEILEPADGGSWESEDSLAVEPSEALVEGVEA